ncbi:DUF2285 domain-containing protein [Sphingobium chlorophenolicum]|uniref:T6SS Transcription factor RovC-like DNA binding domain-containing protein n=1 Tax=Sphingobium chlorophenolicum TaxID=46429 RepID=A0A081R9F6_SPHCR|nr:DUF2285 domain-containing protein [Sphingobium chlorophenolicum]KEQ51829.1 hypothetical protein BV95_03903 [Sphingobium chlorophenolicum]
MRRADRGSPGNGGFTFAEDPGLPACEARVIWHADVDPAILPVSIEAGAAAGEEAIDVAALAPWLRAASDPAGREYVVLTDGRRHIRLDILAGTLLRAHGPVLLRYDMWGARTAFLRMRTLERFLDLVRTGRFRAPLYPGDPAVGRGVELLRVHDARASGATQRDIGEALFGAEAVKRGWDGRTDHIRQRVRRLVKSARAMAEGGYRLLMRSR